MIEYSKYYNLKLSRPWSLSYDVYVLCATTLDSLDTFGKFDIQGEFFNSSYGLGYSAFLTAVTKTTPIFVCQKIKNYSPVEIDKEVVFIPESIIDKSSIKEYLIGKNISISIDGIDRYFGGPMEQGSYLRETEKEVHEILTKRERFAGEVLCVATTVKETLKLKEELDAAQAMRLGKAVIAKEALMQSALSSEVERRNLFDLQKSAQDAKDSANALIIEYNTKITNIAQQQTDVEQIAAVQNRVKSIIIQILNNIRSGLYDPLTIPSFEVLYAQAESELFP